VKISKYIVLGACFSFVCSSVYSKKELTETTKQVVAPKAKKDVVKKAKSTVHDNYHLVNKISRIIYTDGEPIIITMQDFSRKSLDGKSRTKEEVTIDHILFYEAIEKYHMPFPQERVERHINSLRERFGLDDVQIEDLFKKEGYAFEEGKKELAMSYAINDLIQHLIMGRLIVTEQEIEQYHKKNPAIEPAAFRIQKGFLKKDEWTKTDIDALTQDGQHEDRIEWQTAYWLAKDEIAESKLFIADMQPGEIRSIENEDGYEVIKLLKRKKEHTKTLDERRREISDHLRFPKYQKMLDELHKELLSKYEIVDMA